MPHIQANTGASNSPTHTISATPNEQNCFINKQKARKDLRLKRRSIKHKIKLRHHVEPGPNALQIVLHKIYKPRGRKSLRCFQQNIWHANGYIADGKFPSILQGKQSLCTSCTVKQCSVWEALPGGFGSHVVEIEQLAYGFEVGTLLPERATQTEEWGAHLDQSLWGHWSEISDLRVLDMQTSIRHMQFHLPCNSILVR